MRLKNIPRPEGQRADYRFIRDDDSGRTFKAMHEARVADDGSPSLTITISPTGEDGKALLNLKGEPDVTPHNHTFTRVELEDPGFDRDARVASLLAQAAEVKVRELAARAEVLALGEAWTGNKPLALGKRA